MLNDISIIIPVTPNETSHKKLLDDLKGCKAEIVISSEESRSQSLNAGAAKATRPYLWFLHADTHITQHHFEALKQSLQTTPNALHYFDLAFDGGAYMTLNAIGANLRSRLLGLPYGDQGFCISKELFEATDGYPEDTPFGEDLLLVRVAKKKNINLQRIPSKLLTSARKYHDYGWLKLSLYRQWQLIKLLRIKI